MPSHPWKHHENSQIKKEIRNLTEQISGKRNVTYSYNLKLWTLLFLTFCVILIFKEKGEVTYSCSLLLWTWPIGDLVVGSSARNFCWSNMLPLGDCLFNTCWSFVHPRNFCWSKLLPLEDCVFISTCCSFVHLGSCCWIFWILSIKHKQ